MEAKTKFLNILEYSKYFKELIEFERQEEQALHLKEIQRFSPTKRESFGRSILNLQASYQGRSLGNTTLVKLGREKRFLEHEFKVGDLVIITNKKKPTGDEATATITQLTSRSITVAYPHNVPNYLFNKKSLLRLDLFTNDITFSRMSTALTRVTGNQRFKRILMGSPLKKKQPLDSPITFENRKLNSTQKKAVIDSLSYKDIFFLHGPPGTGKTTTLVESIIQHHKKGEKILVCADSNTAIDTLMEKLLEFSESVIRIGNPHKVTPKILEHTLDYQLESIQFFKDAQLLYKQIDDKKKIQQQCVYPSKDLRRGLSDAQIRKYARNRKGSRGVPVALMKKMGAWITHQQAISEMIHKAKILEKLSVEELLEKTSIICSTNSNAGSQLIEDVLSTGNLKFDVSFIDEATQSVEPSTLIPALLSPKLILAGDHKQLPPTVLSSKAKKLNYSLFERLLTIFEKEHYIQLTTQYRMNEEIMKFSNDLFYNSTLKAGENNAHHKLSVSPRNSDISSNCVDIISISSKKELEMQQQHSTSYYNLEEAKKVHSIVESLLDIGVDEKDIGVISPYVGQVLKIKQLLQGKNVEVKSIDGFQGREKEVIIISFVRSNTKGQIGFLKDYRRLNVALTRAKKKLFLIGDFSTLKQEELYSKLLFYYNN